MSLRPIQCLLVRIADVEKKLIRAKWRIRGAIKIWKSTYENSEVLSHIFKLIQISMNKVRAIPSSWFVSTKSGFALWDDIIYSILILR